MRRIVWSKAARTDYRDAAVAVAADNPRAARQIQSRMKAAATLLAQTPIGHPGRVTDTYEKRVLRTPYIIAYALSDHTVTILRIIHERQNWPNEEWPDK